MLLLAVLTPCERKSVEPLAAQHQSLLLFVSAGGWSDDKVLAKGQDIGFAARLRARIGPRNPRDGLLVCWKPLHSVLAVTR